MKKLACFWVSLTAAKAKLETTVITDSTSTCSCLETRSLCRGHRFKICQLTSKCGQAAAQRVCAIWSRLLTPKLIWLKCRDRDQVSWNIQQAKCRGCANIWSIKDRARQICKRSSTIARPKRHLTLSKEKRKKKLLCARLWTKDWSTLVVWSKRLTISPGATKVWSSWLRKTSPPATLFD